jgi:hypothetical protein
MNQLRPDHDADLTPPVDSTYGLGEPPADSPTHQLWATLESAYPAPDPAPQPEAQRGYIWLPLVALVSLTIWGIILGLLLY